MSCVASASARVEPCAKSPPEAQVSLGYLSELSAGRREASSELLEAITSALRVPLWFVLREVSERMAIIDGAVIPDAVPDDLVPVTLIS